MGTFSSIATVLVALAIGAITAVIAFKQKDIAQAQKDIAQAKLKLDLFEKRLAIFRRVWIITSHVIMKPERSVKKYGFATPFNNFRPNAAFLFGREMEAYIDELSQRWIELESLEAEKNAVTDEDFVENNKRRRFLLNYFEEQARKGVKDRFAPFLDFANWK